jgi:hypothetical protein
VLKPPVELKSFVGARGAILKILGVFLWLNTRPRLDLKLKRRF